MRNGVRAIVAGLLAACSLVGFAAAFAVAAKAGDSAAATTSTGSSTTTTTSTPPPTQPSTEPPLPPPGPAPIAFGVMVGNVAVGGMLPAEATAAVKQSFSKPLTLVVSSKQKITLSPSDLRAKANVPKAIRRARVARPGAVIPLDIDVSRTRIRGYVERLAAKLDREPVDAAIRLRGIKPDAVKAQVGLRLKRLASARAVRYALARNQRSPIRLAFSMKRPKVTSLEVRTAIVILRESKQLLFFKREKLVRKFKVATGLSAFPTPLGEFEIVTMQRNPWWYPPPSDWAKDSDPVPPGPGNPLGTRWMGISAPYVGIHGTPDAASIGYSASHGCVRMRITEAEWLFQRVRAGTPVFIVAR